MMRAIKRTAEERDIRNSSSQNDTRNYQAMISPLYVLSEKTA